MGIFDKKDETKDTAGFGDRKEGGATADFSDVTSGASSTAPPMSDSDVYTVRSGDSLSKIAKHFYGDASKWHRIYDANRDKINNPDLIHPGQEFTIPKG